MFRKNIIYVIVLVIGALLLSDILFTYYNNVTITENRGVRRKSNAIKLYYDQIGKVVIHSLDIGLRGYALVPTEKFAQPMNNSRAWKDSILTNVETPLKDFDIDMTPLYVLRDSVDAYVNYCFHLKGLLVAGNDTEFKRLFKNDKGALLWGQYIACERHILTYLSSVDQEAERAIDTAQKRNQLLQIVLFIVSFPTLLYTAYYTGKTFRLSALLQQAAFEKNKILQEQNINLERNVAERTQEILAQNEEILSISEELATQRDTLFLQNKELHEAHKLIEKQNLDTQLRNDSLQQEILKQTQELRSTNEELINHNSQLEQFAFIAAHNLRSPLARILGLANILKISDREDDKNMALQKIVASSMDLDAVVRDLTTILDIQKKNSIYSSIDLSNLLERVTKLLEKERDETQATFNFDVSNISHINGVPPYVESIFYNLLSNAIKYRNPERKPVITVTGSEEDDFYVISVNDNGLGIDLKKHKDNVFNLYKRFHLHVEGKGLGLFLVKGQMTAMGGRIEIESEPNKGTTFRLYFKKQNTSETNQA